MEKLKHNIIDVVVVLAVPAIVVLGYFYVWQGGIGGGTSMTPGQDEVLERGAKVKEALSVIRTITKLDDAIFQDPIFTTLKDRSVPITDEAIGRDNPFTAPDSVSVKTSQPSLLGTTPLKSTKAKK